MARRVFAVGYVNQSARGWAYQRVTTYADRSTVRTHRRVKPRDFDKARTAGNFGPSASSHRASGGDA